jgi:hypothetical protein
MGFTAKSLVTQPLPAVDPGGTTRFISPQPGGRIRGIALAGQPLAVRQHWVKVAPTRAGDTQARDHPALCLHCLAGVSECPHCLAGLDARWKGFLPLQMFTGEQTITPAGIVRPHVVFVVMEITREAWQTFVNQGRTTEANELLGWEVAETREKGNRFAPCRFYRLDTHHPRAPYVDVREHVAKLFGVARLKGYDQPDR